MTTVPRWRPLPSAVGLDPRIRYVTPHACRAWLLLVCASDAAGVVRGAAGMESASILAAVVGCPEVEAMGLLGELEDAELVRAHPTHLVLVDVASWSRDCTPGASLAPEELSEGPTPRPAREIALARLRSSFSKRALATTDARRAWLATDEGQERLAELGLTTDDGEALAATAGRRGGRFGVDRPAVVAPRATDVATVVAEPDAVVANGCSATTAPAVATVVASVSPAPPSETEKTSKTATSEARDPVVAAVVAAVVANGCSATTAPAVATVVASTPLKALFERLQPQDLLPDGGKTERAQINDRIIAAALDTPDGLDAIAAALREPRLIWPTWQIIASKKRRISLLLLAGDPDPSTGERPYTRLAELLAHAAAQVRPQASPPPSSTPAAPRPKRAPLKPLTPEQKASFLGKANVS